MPGPPPPPIDLTDRYCRKCGAELISNVKQCGYSTLTGEPLTHDFKCCPNRRWWNGWDTPHT